MTQPATSPGIGDAGDTAQRMRAITVGLNAAGLDAHLYETRGVLDITATWHQPGGKDIHAIIDEDHYVEIRYWNDPAATPAQVAAVISRVLTVLTSEAPAL
jgi:hypothetical protein